MVVTMQTLTSTYTNTSQFSWLCKAKANTWDFQIQHRCQNICFLTSCFMIKDIYFWWLWPTKHRKWFDGWTPASCRIARQYKEVYWLLYHKISFDIGNSIISDINRQTSKYPSFISQYYDVKVHQHTLSPVRNWPCCCVFTCLRWALWLSHVLHIFLTWGGFYTYSN